MEITNVIKRFYPVKNSTATHLKVELYYSKGGNNVFTYKTERRGYYISVTPVKREMRNNVVLESFVAFTGLKQLLVPVERKSKKKEEEAQEVFNKYVDKFIAINFGEFELGEGYETSRV